MNDGTRSRNGARLTDDLRAMLLKLYGGTNDALYPLLDRIDAFAASEKQAPIPEEPTLEMIEAGKDERMACFRTEGRETNPVSVSEALVRIYKAMIAARPT